jgi:hypothetical protein
MRLPAVPIEATATLPLLHTPPGKLLLKVVPVPEHKLAVPLIVPGVMFTVATAVFLQPLLNV